MYVPLSLKGMHETCPGLSLAWLRMFRGRRITLRLSRPRRRLSLLGGLRRRLRLALKRIRLLQPLGERRLDLVPMPDLNDVRAPGLGRLDDFFDPWRLDRTP